MIELQISDQIVLIKPKAYLTEFFENNQKCLVTMTGYSNNPSNDRVQYLKDHSEDYIFLGKGFLKYFYINFEYADDDEIRLRVIKEGIQIPKEDFNT